MPQAPDRESAPDVREAVSPPGGVLPQRRRWGSRDTCCIPGSRRPGGRGHPAGAGARTRLPGLVSVRRELPVQHGGRGSCRPLALKTRLQFLARRDGWLRTQPFPLT